MPSASLAASASGRPRSRMAACVSWIGYGTRRKAARDAFFPRTGLVSTPIVARKDLTARPRSGPVIVEEYDATTVVPPGWTAQIDADYNIVVEIHHG